MKTNLRTIARKLQVLPLFALALSVLAWTGAYAQITPSADSYTNTADATTNYGAKTLLDVDAASQVSYIQFNLASIPATASVSQATLKLYVNGVTTAGSFNVDYINSAWSESTIDASNAPPLGTTIASNVNVTTAEKNQYILINVTSAVQAWLSGSEKNNGLALVANSTFNATFDSKENTTTSHPPELDIAFSGGEGTITGVTTSSGSGLTGGGTSGTLNLSLTNGCATNQVLQWNGSAWVCSSAGLGTITGVTAGTALTGGGTSGAVTLNLDTTQVPLLGSANLFNNNQAINGNFSSYALTVLSPTYYGLLVEGPESGVGAGIEMVTTGGGMSWQILNTGAGASQAANKLNFRNDSGGVDVLTLTAAGQVGVGITTPQAFGGQLQVNATTENFEAILAEGYTAPSGSGYNGSEGAYFYGGPGDLTNGSSIGGTGIVGVGAAGGTTDGEGGEFFGGYRFGSGYGDGIYVEAGSGYAGYFYGSVDVVGNVSKSGGSFKIDHPLDPANKYLYHSFVESPDMMNIYDGVATLDANGEAVIQMPEWFGVLNRDFRYQLTCIGGFAPTYIAEELTNNQFKIGGGRAGMRVSWQITGIRQDEWANAHRIPVEEEKEERLKGFYLHPELYGAPAEKQIQWARHPEMMKKLQQDREQMKEKQARQAQSVALPQGSTN